MLKAVIFDLDGTLVNSLEDLANATNYAVSFLNIPPHPLEKYKYFVGNGISKLLLRAVPEEMRTEENMKTVREKFFEHYGVHYADNTRAYDKMPELVAELKNQGILVAVVSNKAQAAAKDVVNRIYGDVFDAVVGQREGIPIKPDPTLTLGVLKNFKISAKECAFVGDSGMDAATAVNAGCIPIGVLWGFRKEDELLKNGAEYTVNSADELEQLLKSL